jgi:hypothetical protein
LHFIPPDDWIERFVVRNLETSNAVNRTAEKYGLKNIEGVTALKLAVGKVVAG